MSKNYFIIMSIFCTKICIFYNWFVLQRAKIQLIFNLLKVADVKRQQNLNLEDPGFKLCRANGLTSSGDITQPLFRKGGEKKRRE